MGNPQDTVNILVPNVLRDRLATHRLHPRMPYYEIIEEALMHWEEQGAWIPFVAAPIEHAIPARRPGEGDSAVAQGRT